jgi:hypothetical protein
LANTNPLTNKESALSEIVSDIKRGYFVIPSFQRGVVWTTPDICKLGDSLLWGYPISSLLLMTKSAELDVNYEPIAVANASVTETGTASYVLDGQQRLTAIAKMFIEESNERVFYYDLLGILIKSVEGGSFDDKPFFGPGGVLEFGILEFVQRARPNARLDGDYTCKGFKIARTGERPETRQAHRFIRCDVVLNSGFGKYVNRFLREYFPQVNSTKKPDALEAATDVFTDYLTGLLGGLKLYGIPVTLISEGSNLELVCSVFERVNSSGIKLTTFDLVNAKTFGADAYEDGFASFLKSKISAHQNKSMLLRFFDGSKSGEFGDLARIIRILHVADRLKSGLGAELSNGAMLKQKKEFWFQAFDSARETLFEFVEWAESSGLAAFAPKSFVEYVAAVVLAEPKALQIPEFKRELIRFGLGLGVHNQGFTKSNLRVISEFRDYACALLAQPDDRRQSVPTPAYINSTPLTKEAILSCSYSARGLRYAAILHVMYGQQRSGLFATDIFGQDHEFKRRYLADQEGVSGRAKKFEEHHLVPKSSFTQRALNGIDSIANIVLLSREKNNTISNRRFEEYVKTYAEGAYGRHGQEFRDSLLRNLVPSRFTDSAIKGESFSGDTYQELLDSRAEAIAAYVNEYFGFEKLLDASFALDDDTDGED